MNYFYILTPQGIAEKTKLTINFMKRKIKEYDELKKRAKIICGLLLKLIKRDLIFKTRLSKKN